MIIGFTYVYCYYILVTNTNENIDKNAIINHYTRMAHGIESSYTITFLRVSSCTCIIIIVLLILLTYP